MSAGSLSLQLYAVVVKYDQFSSVTLRNRLTEREARIVAQQAGVDGFFLPKDRSGQIEYIPPHRIKLVSLDPQAIES